MQKLFFTILTCLVFWASTAHALVRNIQDNHRVIYNVIDASGDFVGSQTVTLQIMRMSDGYWLDFNDDTFKNAGWTNKSTNLSEDSTDGFYYYVYNPPSSETGAEEYMFLVDNADSTYGDHQSQTIAYQNIGTSTHSAADVWAVGTRELTALDEDNTTIDLNASTIGTVSNVSDKTGYSLTQTFPTNFADLAITATTGLISVGMNNDKTGYSISGTKTTLDALNDISTAQVNSEVDTALGDYDGPTYTETLNLFRLALRSDSALATDLSSLITSLNADLGSGAGGYVTTTDSQQAIRDRGDSAWITAVGFSTHSAADIWAVGTRELTALDEDNTTIDLNASAVGSVAGAVGSVTGNVGGNVTGSVGSVTGNVGGTINGLTATALADFFDTDSGTTYAGAVSGSVVAEIVDNAGGSSLTEGGIADAVWDELLSGHSTAGTAGKKLSDVPLSGTGDWTANELTEIRAVLGLTDTGTPDNTPSAGALYEIQGATFSTGTDSLEALRNRGDAAWITATGFSTHSAADIWAVGTRALTDKAGFSLSAAGVDAIWDEVITGHSTADSFGKVFDDQIDGLRAYGDSNWLTATGFATSAALATAQADLDNPDQYKADISGLATAAALATAQADLDNPNQYKATGFSTHSAADVWAAGTRTLTANTNLNDPTAGAIADAVWDEVQSGHTTAGTFGKYLDSEVSSAGGGGLTEAGIADAVWDELTAGHAVSGSTGEALTNAGAAGDPWAVSIPGSYTGSQAGKYLPDLIQRTRGR